MTAFFSKKDLERLAGPRAYSRGLASVPAVDALATSGAEITGTVYGSEPWQARLNRRPAGLDGSCDCPRGMAGEFCRHCVAVGLVYLDGPGTERNRGPEFLAAQREIAGLRRLLGVLDREDLIGLLLDCAHGDHDLRRHLVARVDEFVQPGTDVNETELRLADVRALTDPASAIPVYKKHIEARIAARNRRDYAEAARYLQHLKAAYQRMHQKSEAVAYIEGLRAANARKHNLLDEFAKHGL
jgi:uncharacterized Zn finger protein